MRRAIRFRDVNLRGAIVRLPVLPAPHPVEQCDDCRHKGDANQDAEGVFHCHAPISQSAIETIPNQIATPARMIDPDSGRRSTN